jgi:hypothetical protein
MERAFYLKKPTKESTTEKNIHLYSLKAQTLSTCFNLACLINVPIASELMHYQPSKA